MRPRSCFYEMDVPVSAHPNAATQGLLTRDPEGWPLQRPLVPGHTWFLQPRDDTVENE